VKRLFIVSRETIFAFLQNFRSVVQDEEPIIFFFPPVATFPQFAWSCRKGGTIGSLELGLIEYIYQALLKRLHEIKLFVGLEGI
jgi:hypothetical protein